MKNSLPMMQKRMMPVMTLEAKSLSLNWEAIWMAPFSRKTRRKEMTTMTKVLNLASQATMMAVKPRPPAVEVEMVWPAPATAMKPARPQMAPEMAMVRIKTLESLMPAYRAVFWLSPTTAIS